MNFGIGVDKSSSVRLNQIIILDGEVKRIDIFKKDYLIYLYSLNFIKEDRRE